MGFEQGINQVGLIMAAIKPVYTQFLFSVFISCYITDKI